MTTYITNDGDSADEIAWKHYGRQDQQVVEQLLEANPGLADYGPILPANVRVELPEAVKPTVIPGVKLWD